MTDSIAHRGPDGEGQWVNENKNLGLGHRRLSILDLSAASAQPMQHKDRYTITFNGEIYNYIELRNQLESIGYTFQTSGDTEVLLALFAEEGKAMLQKLDGMFAIAIWDNEKEELFCARDRFGEKPFLYSITEDEFVFASEMKAIWAYGVPKQMDENKLSNYVKKGQISDVNAQKTFYSNILNLDAAHYLTVNSSGVLNIVNYWNLDNIEINNSISFEEAVIEYKRLFIESIQLRLRSDVPVGSSLSGGIDSSTIVGVVDSLKLVNQSQKVFSARFKNSDKDEGNFIEMVKDKYSDLESYEVWPNGDEMRHIIKDVVYHQEEPFGSSSIVAQWKVMELAKQNNVTVMLDGQGADEILAGYMPDYNIYLTQLFFEDRKKYKQEYLEHQKKFNLIYPIRKYPNQETLRMKAGRLKKTILRENQDFQSLKEVQKRKLTAVGLKELLRYADRNSMAHQREVRLPFLSHKLIEFVYSLPASFLLKNGWTKYLHRIAFEDVLPNKICWRIDKLGYEPPQKSWLKNEEISKIIKQQAERFGVDETLNGKYTYTNSMDWKLYMSSFF
jgi:asparagine synthase (glutamine-hydrolysing)